MLLFSVFIEWSSSKLLDSGSPNGDLQKTKLVSFAMGAYSRRDGGGAIVRDRLSGYPSVNIASHQAGCIIIIVRCAGRVLKYKMTTIIWRLKTVCSPPGPVAPTLDPNLNSGEFGWAPFGTSLKRTASRHCHSFSSVKLQKLYGVGRPTRKLFCLTEDWPRLKTINQSINQFYLLKMSRDTHTRLFNCEQDNKAETSTNSCMPN